MSWPTIEAVVAAGAILGLLVRLHLTRRTMRALQRRVEQAMTLGDTACSLAEGMPRGRCRRLAHSVDQLVDVAMDQLRSCEVQSADQDELWRTRYVRQRLGEQYVLRQSNSITNESIELTRIGLSQVVEHAQAVLATTSTIETRTQTAMRTLRLTVEATDRAVGVLNALEGSFRRVDGITKFISTVAEQTNLLALNAAMEASRAGQAGRGFGIVAREIKQLATETSRSAAGINELMGAVRRGTAEMADAVAGVSQRVLEIEEASGDVDTAVIGQHETLDALEMCANDVISQMDLLVMLAGDVDRRRHRRVAVSGLVTLERGGETVCGDLLDLSEGGLQCVVEKAATIADGHEVRVVFAIGGERQSIDAEVVWRRAEELRDRIGLQFQDLATEQQAMVKEWISGLLSQGDE